MKNAESLMLPSPWRLPFAALALMLASLLALTAETAVSMVRLWQAATTYHHCFLVLPIALALVWLQRKRLAALAPRHEPMAIIPLIAFAALWLIGRAGQIQLFEHVALIGMAVAIIVALFGRMIARMIAFPLAFLFFMVPFGDVFVPGLQHFTADFSVMLLRFVDIPVFHDGIMIETPSGLFEVAEACAGIRFLIANVMVGALFAHLAMGRPWKWALFMAIAVVLPIIANGFRAFGIILIAYLTDNQYAAGVDHLVYGWGFFAAIMLAFLAIGNAIADWPSAEGGADGPSADGFAGVWPEGLEIAPKAPAWRAAVTFPLMLTIVAMPLYARFVLDAGEDRLAIDPKLMLEPTLALDLGPACKVDPATRDRWRPRFEQADMTQGLVVDCGGRPVDLFLAYYAREREGSELIQHGNRLADGENWTRMAASWHPPGIDDLPKALKKEELFGRQAGDRVVLAWYWIGGRPFASDWQAKAYRLYRKLLGQDEPSALIALSAAYDDRPGEALPDIETVLRRHKGIGAYLEALKPEAR